MCKITGEVKGLEPGEHGFHVHQFGDGTNGMFLRGFFIYGSIHLQSILGREVNEHLRMGEHQALPVRIHVNQEIII